MNCADLRLDEYFDGELDEAARAAVDGHLASCAACRAELERLRKLEGVLKSVPIGATPDADRFLLSVRARSRRSPFRIWGVAAAAGIIGIACLWMLSLPPKGAQQVLAAVREYSEKPSVALELKLKAGGSEALGNLESLVDSSDGKLQFAAASLLFKLADAPTRDRVLARFQQKKEPGGPWMLSEPGTENSDDELVPVTVSLAVDGQDRWAMNVLRKLNRLNLQAQRKIVDSVVTLLHSTNVDIQRHALEIVKKLEIEFPLPAVVDLLDSPELGEEALRFLRQETQKDFGKDKEAWLKAIGGRN
ncbi:MAG: zf-HC2 domain-containing protein [Planctomycetes bacterium]|nr:zf-HC2 domain-containing protein [Planctomycetota bacterium]